MKTFGHEALAHEARMTAAGSDPRTTTRTITASPPSGGFRRADIVLEGVDQAGRSYEGRVFVNNPSADRATPRTPDSGYAGAFHVYGHGMQQRAASANDPESPRPRLPITKYIVASDVVRSALQRTHTLTITVVSIPAVAQPHFLRALIVFDRDSGSAAATGT
ncbi:MAG: hypothetical protein JOY58_08855 [Solirubrobacterales bacterium]|nr:hypothetical protein [Solirubrobacterales bacterium]